MQPPGGPMPQLMATILMILGAMTWGNVIATFCGVVATINPEVSEFRRIMDDLNRCTAPPP